MKKKRRKAAEEQPSVVDDPTSEAQSFGPWLRRQREGRDIELRDIAMASKISVRYLDALENSRFEALPAEIFTKGFLRQYASFVGLDAEEVVNYYLTAKTAADTEKADGLPEELRLDKRKPPSPAPYIFIALLVTALLVAAVWWLSPNRQAGTASPAIETSDLSEERGSRDASGTHDEDASGTHDEHSAPGVSASSPIPLGEPPAGAAEPVTQAPREPAPTPSQAVDRAIRSPIELVLARIGR